MRLVYLFSFLCTAQLLTAEDSGSVPQATEQPVALMEEPISTTPELHALIITKEAAVPNDFAEYCGVVSDVLPGHIIEQFRYDYLGKPISKPLLEEIRQNVLKTLVAEDEFTLRAFYPDQDVSSGVVCLQVAFPTTREVEVKGNDWESKESYEKAFGLKAGQPFDTRKVLSDVAWFNRNPFHHAEVVVAPRPAQSAVDVDFLVKDRLEVRPFAGVDNTGTDVTNQVRWYAGATWGKAFWRSDVLTYQFISAPSPHRFYSHNVSYLVFLPGKHELLFFGGFSKCHPKVKDFSQEGITTQVSARHSIPLGALYKSTQHEVTWGIDYKNLNSNVFFVEISPTVPLISHQVNVSQFYLGYTRQDRFLAKFEVLFSPVKMLPHESDVRYGMLRPHATAQYLYGKASLADSYGSKENGYFSWTARAQAATGPLLPSEQFALGGYDTVRGYQERDYLADNALCLNAELHMPKLGFTEKKDALIFLAFTDFGVGFNYKSEMSDQKSQHLWSVGPGLRYQYGSYVNLRVDYGFQLHHIFGQNAFGRFHLGGSLSY